MSNDRGNQRNDPARNQRYGLAFKWRFLIGLVLFAILVAILWRPVGGLLTLLFAFSHAGPT